MLFAVNYQTRRSPNRRHQKISTAVNSHKKHHHSVTDDKYVDEYNNKSVNDHYSNQILDDHYYQHISNIDNKHNINNNNESDEAKRKLYQQYQYENNNNHKAKVKQKDIYPEIIKSKTKNQKMDKQTKRFNVQRECGILYNNITLFAKNKSKQQIIDAFIELIIKTNTDQRQAIKEYYQGKYLMDLDHYIHMNFKGIIKRMLLYSMQTEMQRHLYLLKVGIKKMKDIKCIIPLLCVKDSDTIQQLMEYYDKGMFTKSLQSEIIKLTQNDLLLRSFLVKILSTKRRNKFPYSITETFNDELIDDDITFLTRILNETNWNEVEVSRFIDIFSQKSFEYLREMAMMFELKTKVSLIDTIHNSLGSNHGIGYAINCILTFLMDKHRFYGDLLTKSMEKSGHKHILFWRIIIDRNDIDLDEILDSFGIYENGKSDVDRYNFQRFIKINVHKEDVFATNLLSKLCNL